MNRYIGNQVRTPRSAPMPEPRSQLVSTSMMAVAFFIFLGLWAAGLLTRHYLRGWIHMFLVGAVLVLVISFLPRVPDRH